MLNTDKFGFVLWEGFTLLLMILGVIVIVMLRRLFSGRAAFTDRDWHFFFGRPKVAYPTLRLLVNFGTAVLLCFSVLALGELIFAPFGPAVVTLVILITSFGIVKKLLL